MGRDMRRGCVLCGCGEEEEGGLRPVREGSCLRKSAVVAAIPPLLDRPFLRVCGANS